jgi:hypothetical protein
MKVTVLGVDRSEGVSMKSGTAKPYAIGKVFAAVRIDGPNAKGSQGTEYQVEVELVRRIEHLPMPFEADLTIEDVMRYGKRESKVFDITPISIATKPAIVKAA